MKPRSLVLIVVVLLLAGCSRQGLPSVELESLATWSNLGGKVTVADEFIAALAFNASSDPIVVTSRYSDINGGNYRLYVKQWLDGRWKILGGIININAGRTASGPDLAVDKLGRPVVAWTETNAQGYNHLYVKRWNGEAWGLLGGRLNVESAVNTKVTIDNQNRPVVAWEEYSKNLPLDNWNLYVKRWENDSGWVQLGGYLDVVESKGVGRFSIVVDRLDRPIVAWDEVDLFSFEANVYVKRWNGSRWGSLGGSVGTNTVNGSPSSAMVLTSTGKLIVAFEEGHNEVIVKHWDGNGVWTALGPIRQNCCSNFFLSSSGDTPIIAWWIDYVFVVDKAYVKRWNGVDRWLNVGGQPVLTESAVLDLAVSPSGVPTLAYRYAPEDPNQVDASGYYIMNYR